MRNPASGVRVIVDDTRPAKRKHLTADETRRLLVQIPADHADLAYLMAATGLRISEAFALVWSDFATGNDGPTLTVRESKTAAGRRTIPLAPATAKRLTKRQTATKARKADRSSPTGEVERSTLATSDATCSTRPQSAQECPGDSAQPQARHGLAHG